MVALQTVQLTGGSRRTIAVVGLFGAVMPMVFGMAYLLLPASIGRTLSTRWLPGIHFLLAYLALGFLVVDTAVGGNAAAVALGSLAGLGGGGLALLAGGVTLPVAGSVTTTPRLHLSGSVLELLGTGVYASLLGRRLLRER